MIRNIIFDMGNVLLDYDPQIPLNTYLDNEDDRAVIRKELFEGPEWIQRDLGKISLEDMYANICKRVPEHLWEPLKKCVYGWDICMTPIDGALDFCTYAKEKGYAIYVLSNAGEDFYRYFPEFAPLDFFDGVVVSSDIHIIKPDVEIFHYLLEKYQLNASECLFIDDREENVEGAKSAGMEAILFHNDFEEIEHWLMEKRKAEGLLWTDTAIASRAQLKARGLAYDFNHTRPEEAEKRIAMLPEMFGSVGKNVWIEPPITFAFGKTVSIGEGTYINSNLTLVDDYIIKIGKGVLIAPNVTISATGHPVHYKLRPHGEMYSFPVIIGDNVWIGSNVVICPGVTIGENSVIGAGSIVTKDIPANCVAAGNPCKVQREITDRDLEYYYRDLRIDR